MKYVHIGNTNCRIVCVMHIRNKNEVVSCYSCALTRATDHSGELCIKLVETYNYRDILLKRTKH